MSTESTDDVPPSPEAPVSSSPGPQQVPPPASPMSEKKLVAGILGILLGGLGIHKFYLGYQKEGIIMLVVFLVGWFLCGFPSMAAHIVGLVEGILYLTKTNEEFDRLYVTGRKPWF